MVDDIENDYDLPAKGSGKGGVGSSYQLIHGGNVLPVLAEVGVVVGGPVVADPDLAGEGGDGKKDQEHRDRQHDLVPPHALIIVDDPSTISYQDEFYWWLSVDQESDDHTSDAGDIEDCHQDSNIAEPGLMSFAVASLNIVSMFDHDRPDEDYSNKNLQGKASMQELGNIFCRTEN